MLERDQLAFASVALQQSPIVTYLITWPSSTVEGHTAAAPACHYNFNTECYKIRFPEYLLG